MDGCIAGSIANGIETVSALWAEGQQANNINGEWWVTKSLGYLLILETNWQIISYCFSYPFEGFDTFMKNEYTIIL